MYYITEAVYTENEYPRWEFTIFYLIPFGTIWGNIFVCLAVYLERRLRHRFNLFLVSLAVSDLLCAMFVMPVSAWHMIMGRNQDDLVFCLVWYSLDIFFTATTIIHLCNISLDRYLTLRSPFETRQKRSRHPLNSLVLRIILSWLISFSIAGPLFMFAFYQQHEQQTPQSYHQQEQRPQNPQLLHNQQLPQREYHKQPQYRNLTELNKLTFMHTNSNQSDNDKTVINLNEPKISYKGCGPNDPSFVLTAIGITFALPLIIMIVTYFLTIHTLRKHMKQIEALGVCTVTKFKTKEIKTNTTGNKSGFTMVIKDKLSKIQNSIINNEQTDLKNSQEISNTNSNDINTDINTDNDINKHHKHNNDNNNNNQYKEKQLLHTTPSYGVISAVSDSCFSSMNRLDNSIPNIENNNNNSENNSVQIKNHNRYSLERIHKGKRALRVIGVLFLMFITCYLPFFIIYTIDVLCVECHSWTGITMPYLEWLGYLNSMLNPFVYHIFNPTFRRTFRKMMHCFCCHRPRHKHHAIWRRKIDN